MGLEVAGALLEDLVGERRVFGLFEEDLLLDREEVLTRNLLILAKVPLFLI